MVNIYLSGQKWQILKSGLVRKSPHNPPKRAVQRCVVVVDPTTTQRLSIAQLRVLKSLPRFELQLLDFELQLQDFYGSLFSKNHRLHKHTIERQLRWAKINFSMKPFAELSFRQDYLIMRTFKVHKAVVTDPVAKVVSLNRMLGWHRAITWIKYKDCRDAEVVYHNKLPLLPGDLSKVLSPFERREYIRQRVQRSGENSSPPLTSGLYSDAVSLYSRGYVSLINETVFDLPIPCCTEKVLISMYAMRPFILCSSPLSLHMLRNLGYKTFSQWWDESYDLEFNRAARLKKVFSVVDWVLSRSTNELVELLKDMRDTLTHNKYHRPNFRKFLTTKSVNKDTETMYQIQTISNTVTRKVLR